MYNSDCQLHKYSTVQCFNEEAMTKVKNSEVRLCCYSYSDYCLKATGL